jgi:hypothetical protein
MALQGNPFLGKLKIPAPDLSRIPETPFDSPPAKPDKAQPSAALTADALPQSNRLQPTSKDDPIRFQTVSDIGFNRTQQVSNQPSNRLQTPAEPTNGNLLKPNETVTNRFQTVSETASDIGFKLPPIGELCVLRYLADHESAPGASIPIRRREIATATAQSLAGIKTALSRLSKTKLVELVEFKCGKVNGFTSYRLTTQARTVLASKMAMAGLGFNRFQTVSETASIGFPSSSSSLDLENFKTTTSEGELFKNAAPNLSPEWQQVDISPLASMGFTQSHLIQIIRQGKLSATETQDSVNFFAFDLSRNGLKPNSPLNFFMGIVRKGIPYAPPENYESPADEARRKTREFKERKERERQAEEKKIIALAFSEWRRGVSTEELTKLLPEYARKPGPLQESALESHFEKNVWSELETNHKGEGDTERQQVRAAITQSLGEVQG